MATSSILTNIKITDPKKVEDFVRSIPDFPEKGIMFRIKKLWGLGGG